MEAVAMATDPTPGTRHLPVMLEEVLTLLRPRPGADCSDWPGTIRH